MSDDIANEHTKPINDAWLVMRRPPAGRRSVVISTVQLVFAAVAVLTVVVAAALPSLTARTGSFTDSEVPVHADTVDGWACHLFGACEDPFAHASGPIPTQLLRGAAGHGVRVECVLGNFYKINQPVSGWVPQHAVRTSARPIGCYAGEF